MSTFAPHRLTPTTSPVRDLYSPGMYSDLSRRDPVIPGINASMTSYGNRMPSSSSSGTGYLHSDWSQGDKKSNLRMTPINLQIRLD